MRPQQNQEMSCEVRYANGEVRTLSLGPDDRTAAVLLRAGLSSNLVGGLICSVGGEQVDPQPSVSCEYKLPGLAVANHSPRVVLSVKPGGVLEAFFVHRTGGQFGSMGCVTSLIPDAVAMKPIWDAMKAWHQSVVNKIFPPNQGLEGISLSGTQRTG